MKKNKYNIKKTIVFLFISFAFGFVIFASLMCALAITLCNVDLPLNLLPPLTLLITCLAVLTSAFVFAFLVKKMGLLLGVLFGFVVYTILIIIALVQNVNIFTQLAAIKAFSIICSGALGGYLGVIKATQKRRIRR